MPFNKSFALLLLMVLVWNVLNGQNDWKLLVDKKEIQVFTRNVEEFKYKSFKGVTQVNSQIKDVLDVLTKDEEFSSWVYKYREGEIVEKISDSEIYFYSATDLPWPISDRDDVTHVKIINCPNGTIIIELEDVPDYLPPKKSRVRIPFMKGHWKLIPVEEEKTEIILEVLANPGGAIPAWIVNLFITEGPFKTFQNLRKILDN